MPITEKELRNRFGRKPERIAYKSAGAVRKWMVRRLGDQTFAILKFGKVVHTCTDTGEAYKYIMDCIDIEYPIGA
jgi:hypothetical protein